MGFESDLKRFANLTDQQMSAIHRKVCLDLTTDIVKGTPVDTGRARANWQGGVNAIPQSTLNGSDKIGDGTIAKASAKIAQSYGKVYYLANNLPYIYRLEFVGWSKQAPTGWVRAAVDRVKL